MEPDVVPPDLTRALLRAGYRVGGPVGVGAHGPAWAATGTQDGRSPGSRVVVTVLDVPAGSRGQAVRSRVAALRGVSHEHLAEIVDVAPVSGPAIPAADGAWPGYEGAVRWAVLVAEVPGTNLAAMLAARSPLSDGETVTLTVPLAEALAALHEAGLVHGDVSPANVVVRPDGRPVLVDLLSAVSAGSNPGAPHAHGTPGFAAPAARDGAELGPADDVFALGRVALAALSGVADSALRELLELACAPEPADRPSAAGLAAGCFAAAPPEPIVVPDAAVLARTTLARLGGGPGSGSAATVRPSGSKHRAGRGGLLGAGRLAIAAGALTICGAVVAGVIAWGPLGGAAPAGRGERAGAAAEPTASGTIPGIGANLGDEATPGSSAGLPVDPVAAAVALTERRAAVLVSGDPARLAEVDLVGAGAHGADLDLLDRLAAAGERIEGLAATVVEARSVEEATSSAARVEVTSAPTAHRRVSAADASETVVPAQPPRTVVLSLVWTADGWRVAEVLEPGALDPGAGGSEGVEPPRAEPEGGVPEGAVPEGAEPEGVEPAVADPGG